MKILNIILGWLLAQSIMACSPSALLALALLNQHSGQGEQQGIYEGTDIKEEFLKNNSGQYEFSKDWSDYEHTKSLKINPDGTYEIAFDELRKGDKYDRTITCSGFRRGKILYIKKIGAKVDHLTTGFSTQFIGKARYLDSYLFLSESTYELTKTKAEHYSDITRKSEVLTGDQEPTPAEYMDTCSEWNRTNPEVVHIERVLPNALVVSDVWRSRNAPVSNRFALKKKDDWVWITGNFAREMIAEASERVSVSIGGIRAFGVEPETLNLYKRNFDLTAKIETGADNAFKMSFGTTVIDSFYPLMTVEGKLVGVSYRPSTKEFVMHLSQPQNVEVSPKTYGFGELDRSVRDMLATRANYFYEVKGAITQKQNDFIQIGMNMGESKPIQISAKEGSNP